MLAYTGATSGFSFSKSLHAHFEYFNLDSSSGQSQSLGVSKSCIRSWLADNALPKIDEFLNVLQCFNVKPVEFFTQRHLGLGSAERTQNPLKLAIRPKKRRSKAELDHERTEEFLNKALASRAYSRVSFRSLCENELKQSHGAVRNRYPEMAKEYCSKHLLFRSARSRVATAGIKAEITEAAELCHELGMPANKRNMVHFMKNPGVFRAEWTNDFVADLQNKA
ncbi:hypothetical protein [Pelagicoccus sp. SDUM812005]|uniref:hypothetical protein n=1 Tax=Pelagicoccus sp. SDUM812005 TaxID=3041257 RepID=UPI0028122250|nr:hypothetical protein [Pelagicoccus sp. SDUM812005]